MALTRINNQALPTVDSDKLPAGTVLQVVTTEKTDAGSLSVTLNTHADVPDMSLSITPKSTNSKILLLGQITYSGGGYISYFNFRFVRGSTVIGVGDTAGSRLSGNSGWLNSDTLDTNTIKTMPMQAIDSPSSTTALTYKMQISQSFGSGSQTVYINRSTGDSDGSSNQRNITMMTAIEVAG